MFLTVQHVVFFHQFQVFFDTIAVKWEDLRMHLVVTLVDCVEILVVFAGGEGRQHFLKLSA